MSGLEDGMRVIADDLIDGFVERGRCDIAEEFARKFPGTVFFHLVVGADDDDVRRLEPLARIIGFDADLAKRGEAIGHLRRWVAGVFAARAFQPDSSGVVQAVRCLRDTGVDFTDEELYTGFEILALGGLGTSADLIGGIVCILSRDPDLQQRVRSDLGLVPALIEEALRLEPPLTVAFRTATCDVTIAGHDVKKGEKVGLFFGAANRDPAVFDHPHQVDVDRTQNPHLTFSAGVHRCIGSNLARLQVKVATERLLTRLSPFRIPDGERVEYMTRQERGPSSVPLEFPPGKKLAG
jgi:cytochrome P450